MVHETINRINENAMEEATEFDSAFKTERIAAYFQFATGLMAVIGMIVFPILLQYNGVDFKGEGIQYFPSIWAGFMGVVLVTSWVWRFKRENKELREYEAQDLKKANEIARVFNETGYGPLVVDNSGLTPQIVLKTSTHDLLENAVGR